MGRRWRYLIFCLAPAIPLANAETTWHLLRSPNFELYTTAGERKGRETILYFEQVRSFFSGFTKTASRHAAPVRIIAFNSAKEFEPFKMTSYAAAYYLGSAERDYIVMGSIGAEYFPVAIHEYTHLVVKNAGLKLPAWLNEGLAEVYETLKPVANKIQVGAVEAHRLRMLIDSKWFPLETLTDMDPRETLHGQNSKASVFYSQSWALTHMLMLSQEFRLGFPKLVAALQDGKSAAEAFHLVYGRTLAALEKDLNHYVRGDRFYAVLFDSKLEKSAERPDSRIASTEEATLAIAGLLELMEKKQDQARAMYAGLNSWEAEEGLARLALRARNQPRAIEHYAKAVEKGSRNVRGIYQYAQLLLSNGEPEKARETAKRALEIDPAFTDVRLFAGYAALSARDYKDALALLRPVKSITPEQALRYFSGLALAFHETGDREEAKAALKRAKDNAKSSSEIDRVASLERYFSARERPVASSAAAAPPVPVAPRDSDAPPELKRRPRPQGGFEETIAEGSRFRKEPTQSISGTIAQVDCAGTTARLHLIVEGKKRTFTIDDPQKVEIRNTGSITHEFTCGPQKALKVKIEYAEPDRVRAIEFP